MRLELLLSVRTPLFDPEWRANQQSALQLSKKDEHNTSRVRPPNSADKQRRLAKKQSV